MRSFMLLLGFLATFGEAATTSSRPRSDGRCGVAFRWALCDSDGPYGGCCSSDGYCGSTETYCSISSGCQLGCSAAAVIRRSPFLTTIKSSSTTSEISSSTTSSVTTTLFPSSTVTMQSNSKTSTMFSATSSRTGKAFAHYMVGSMTPSEAVIDIQQAQAMGLDALALNVVTASADATWQSNALSYLFEAANAAGFKVFFSFDMTRFSGPADFIPLLQQYYYNDAYFKYNNLPFVSTFYGGNLNNGYSSPNAFWQAKYRDALMQLNMPTYFVPSFSDSSSTSAKNFFSAFPMVDGNFGWDASWPWEGDGLVNVSCTEDATYLSRGHARGKTYMMGISPIQFKHLEGQNWYRRGGLNFALRIAQILSLSPDFIEIQTWNDSGESHYIGPIWPEAIAGTAIPAYTDGYDHTAWQILMSPFITAYKAGVKDISMVVPTGAAVVQGVFWHATLLTSASCAGDTLGKPSGMQNMQDTIAVAVLIATGVSGITVNVYSGGSLLGRYGTVQGLNAWEVPNMKAGLQRVDVLGADGTLLLTATGKMSVAADSNNCNYNPQVVALQ